MSTQREAVHQRPVWRDRANFIIGAELTGTSDAKSEQLWAKQLSDDTFEICCIPFFVYEVALGDVVQTAPAGGRRYMVEKVVRPSGRFVFRVWFGDSFQPSLDVRSLSSSKRSGRSWSGHRRICSQSMLLTRTWPS